jgi:predicted Zn finger-like uncharacterized protein
MRLFGVFLIVVSAILFLCWLCYDTTVWTSEGRVHNFGLLADKQALLIATGFFFVGGLLMCGFGAVAAQGRPKTEEPSQLTRTLLNMGILRKETPTWNKRGYNWRANRAQSQVVEWLENEGGDDRTPQPSSTGQQVRQDSSAPRPLPMPTRIVACPHCQTHITDDGGLAGRTVACPQCRKTFTMPLH